MNRLTAVLAAALLAPAMPRAQEAAAGRPQDAAVPQEQQPPQQEASFDASAIQGKVDSLAGQYAETKNDVAGLKKLKFSGYLQPRWEWRENASYTPSANATPSSAPANDGFYIRRGRFKAVYDADWSQFALQLDATPGGVSLKEAFASVKLPWKGFAVDAGLQLVPFGYEVGVRSSSDLDLLERAAVTRYFLSGEYDVGVALKGFYGPFNFKVGVFNGNGVDAKTSGLDNDQYKDVIGRLGLDLGAVTGGVSGWYGKTVNYVNLNATTPDTRYDRYRVGGDLQVYLDLLPVGGTALKGEYIWGRTGIGNQNDAGAGVNLGKTGHGWYGLVTQNVGPWNQVALRYEQFTADNGASVDGPTNKTVKRQDAVQAALHTFVGGNAKVSLAWFHPMNGTRGDAAPSDPKADEYIVQTQVKF